MNKGEDGYMDGKRTKTKIPKGKDVPRAKRTQAEYLVEDIISLIWKIVMVLTLGVLVFTFLFGICRNTSPDMDPALKDGDLVIYYRLDKRYEFYDAAVVKIDGNPVALRVIAVAGDEVDIRDGKLYINGWEQTEARITKTTERYTEGVDFPLTVPEGEIFVLGDNRTKSTDSRIFGTVPITDTAGKVMAVIRCRGI